MEKQMKDRFEIFTTQIAKISRNIRKIKTEEMLKYNLKSPHVSCLYYLYKSEGTLTSKQLCEVCDEDKAAISRSIEFLKERGYIDYNPQNEKKYKSPITLTQKGEEVASEVAEKIDSVLKLASEGLSEKNRQIFYQSLILISDNLQKISDSNKN